jgi:hypothetical protein
MEEQDNEIKRLQTRKIIGSVRRKCALKDLPDEIKLHVRSMKEIMKYVIVRNLKFQERSWDNYSKVEGTVCTKVIGSLDLPLQYTKRTRSVFGVTFWYLRWRKLAVQL